MGNEIKIGPLRIYMTLRGLFFFFGLVPETSVDSFILWPSQIDIAFRRGLQGMKGKNAGSLLFFKRGASLQTQRIKKQRRVRSSQEAHARPK